MSALLVRRAAEELTMAEPDRTKIGDDWAFRGFSCDLWTDAPGQRWEDFRHPTDELVTVLAGQVEFEITGEIHHPQVGKELLIPAGTILDVVFWGSDLTRHAVRGEAPQCR